MTTRLSKIDAKLYKLTDIEKSMDLLTSQNEEISRNVSEFQLKTANVIRLKYKFSIQPVKQIKQYHFKLQLITRGTYILIILNYFSQISFIYKAINKHLKNIPHLN